jgi:hypothetical protein
LSPSRRSKSSWKRRLASDHWRVAGLLSFGRFQRGSEKFDLTIRQRSCPLVQAVFWITATFARAVPCTIDEQTIIATFDARVGARRFAFSTHNRSILLGKRAGSGRPRCQINMGVRLWRIA